MSSESTPATPANTPSPSATNLDDAPPGADFGADVVQIGFWTGIGVLIVVMMCLSGWFSYRRGKKKRAKLEQQKPRDQEQGHINGATNNEDQSTNCRPTDDALSGVKPELSGVSVDPASVRTELPNDVEQPLLSGVDQENGREHNIGDGNGMDHNIPGQGLLSEMPGTAAGGAVVVCELEGSPIETTNSTASQNAPAPLREARTETGQVEEVNGEEVQRAAH
ncbi:hypothetical protein V8F20_011518 [Naviculisporaceae sp. PSN 640]